jgi:plasmid stabilization system protein ParE
VTVVWAPTAVGHLTALRAYIARESPGAAQQIASLLLAAAEHLAEFPETGRHGRLPGTREWVVPRTPYVIPYRLQGGRLEILGVFHGRQRWPERL